MPGADDAALAALDQIRGQRDGTADEPEQPAMKKKAKKAKKAAKAKATESAELDAMKNLVVELQQMLASVKVDA